MTPVPLHAARVDEAAEMLTRAFYNDPFQSYIFPDPEERRSLSPPFFSVLLWYGVLAGEVWTIDSALRGLAVLWPPRHRELNPDMLEESGFNRLPSTVGEEAFGRFTSFLDYLAPFRSSGVPVPHWYTMILGVDPGHQGQGLGRMLLNHMFERADTENVPCYLETTQPRNVLFYTNSGFSVLEHGTEPQSGVQYWTFRRDPRPSSRRP